jgi:HK97 family phage major capsid protein
MKVKLTQALKDHAVKSFGVKADATDARFSAVVAAKMLSGGLTAKEYQTLSGGDTTTPVVTPKSRTAPAITSEAVDDLLTKKLASLGYGTNTTQSPISPEVIFGKAASMQIRVKGAVENYSKSRDKAYVPKRAGIKGNGDFRADAGSQAMHCGRPMEHPSELDKAIAAVTFKMMLRGQLSPQDTPRGLRITDHDMDLWNWAVRNEKWTGYVDGKGNGDLGTSINRRMLNEMEYKTLLDDSVSGGIEVAPVVFDEAIILTPVLYGELFPLVNVKNISRGRRMHSAAMVNPTFTSGVAEGTTIQPFNTAAFTTAFDTTIFSAVGAMEIGQDWEEDSPVDLGSSIIEQYGLKALEWLDRVIAVGDGVSEPQGIFNASGTTIVNSDNSAGGPPTISDLEGLLFGLPKQFRNEPGARCVYLSNDTGYRRVRAIQVGPGDERRVLGYEEEEYKALGKPYKVQNNIANGLFLYANLARYRMYRRLGLTVRVETGGRTLALANLKLLVLRMRFGAQLELGAAAAVMPDGQQ